MSVISSLLREFSEFKRHACRYPPYFASAQLRKINKAEYAYCTCPAHVIISCVTLVLLRYYRALASSVMFYGSYFTPYAIEYASPRVT
jgi:hypothetical protein